MRKIYAIGITGCFAIAIAGYTVFCYIRTNELENIALVAIKKKHPDLQRIEPMVRPEKVIGHNTFKLNVEYIITFHTRESSHTWCYIKEYEKWMIPSFEESGFCDP